MTVDTSTVGKPRPNPPRPPCGPGPDCRRRPRGRGPTSRPVTPVTTSACSSRSPSRSSVNVPSVMPSRTKRLQLVVDDIRRDPATEPWAGACKESRSPPPPARPGPRREHGRWPPPAGGFLVPPWHPAPSNAEVPAPISSVRHPLPLVARHALQPSKCRRLSRRSRPRPRCCPVPTRQRSQPGAGGRTVGGVVGGFDAVPPHCADSTARSTRSTLPPRARPRRPRPPPCASAGTG